MSLFGQRHGPYRGYQVAHEHVAGFYFVKYEHSVAKRFYLPQVELRAHATILATSSRVVLTQTFVNPSKESIEELRYTFPLYDGVSVVGFVIHVGSRTISGIVKEKEQARVDYNEAVSQGQTAGLLEQLPDASDVFSTTLGNVPADTKVVVEITYIGELKHDAETDGVRFTIPTSIAPRYGGYPGELLSRNVSNAGSIEIVVDSMMAEGSFIQEVRSPSHPIAVSLGNLSTAPNADPKSHQASATLSLGSSELDKDFVLQLRTKDVGIPKALLETHPTIPNQRALLTTLVPKFSLPSEKPEIVFLVDRSGSMQSNVSALKSAMKVLLRSLPVGVKFNICSFGSQHSFLWTKSEPYTQRSLQNANAHVDTFLANYGGTEMLTAVQAVVENRFKDMPLEVILLTDGEIWNQQLLFDYINKEVADKKAPLRFFTLGIGRDVSHALIEGIARAGNGFTQTVAEGEKFESKLVRMLKGALTPHITDYQLEVKYAEGEDTEDDFELIEKVQTKLHIAPEERKEKKPISLFDPNAMETDEKKDASTKRGFESRYDHLPKIEQPKILQAPHRMPPLFPFIRTSVYLLFSPESASRLPTTVVLKATSRHGPLRLEIPVQVLEEPGTTIHQLAAKRAVQELEESAGWLREARDADGALLKEELEGQFSDIVEREAVRLGTQFQVGGKWCSFVAVEKNGDKIKETSSPPSYSTLNLSDEEGGADVWCSSPAPAASSFNHVAFGSAVSNSRSRGSGSLTRKAGSAIGGLFGGFGQSKSPVPPPPPSAFAPAPKASPNGFASFASKKKERRSEADGSSRSRMMASPGSTSPIGMVAQQESSAPPSGGLFGSSTRSSGLLSMSHSARAPSPRGGGLFGSRAPDLDRAGQVSSTTFLAGSPPSAPSGMAAYARIDKGPAQAESPLNALINGQEFEGYWTTASKVWEHMGVSGNDFLHKYIANLATYASGRSMAGSPELETLLVTVLVVAYFEVKLAGEKDVWELVVDKAREWVEQKCQEDKQDGEALYKQAEKLWR